MFHLVREFHYLNFACKPFCIVRVQFIMIEFVRILLCDKSGIHLF
jgi:hypothetical protein